jgi:hypothetical protein
MTRTDTLARARGLDRPQTAYLVRFPDADGTVVETDLTWAELARDTTWVTERLRGHGLAAGQQALVTASGFEGPWIRPVIDALRALSVPYAIAEAMGWDHGRTAVFQRELRPDAIIGLSAETLEGLSGTADLREMFHGTPVLLARPAAVRLLRGVGVAAATFAYLGPALAVECPLRQGAHVNAAEWRVGARDGEQLYVASVEGRGGLPETPLGIRGSVLEGTCGCGSEDPRVVFL